MGQIAEETGFLAVFLREGHSGDLLEGCICPMGCVFPAQPAPGVSAGPATPLSTLALVC